MRVCRTHLRQHGQDHRVPQHKQLVAEAQLHVGPADEDELGGAKGSTQQHGPPVGCQWVQGSAYVCVSPFMSKAPSKTPYQI